MTRAPLRSCKCQRGPKSGLYLILVASPLCKSFTTISLFGCLRLRCSAAWMANSLRSRYVRGVPSIEISNRESIILSDTASTKRTRRTFSRPD